MPITRTDEKQGIPDDYVTQITKLIPVEIVGAYTALQQFLGPTSLQNIAIPDWTHAVRLWWIFGALLVLTPIYIAAASKASREKVHWFQVTASTIAYAVWAFALGGPFQLTYSWYDPPVAAAVLVVVAVALPPLGSLFSPAPPVEPS